jgi:chloramphenicol 3-O-phosphotransferase
MSFAICCRLNAALTRSSVYLVSVPVDVNSVEHRLAKRLGRDGGWGLMVSVAVR